MLVTKVTHMKIMAMTVFHHVKCVSSLAVGENPHPYCKVGIFVACPRITCTVFLNPTEESVLTPTLSWRPAAIFPTGPEEKGQTAYSAFIRCWSDQAYGWLMKIFRMFGIASHLVRSKFPRRNILDSEIKQGRETLLQNKRRFTAQSRVLTLCRIWTHFRVQIKRENGVK